MIHPKIIPELMKRLQISKIGVYKKIEKLQKDLKIIEPEVSAYTLAFQNGIKLHKYGIDPAIFNKVETALRVLPAESGSKLQKSKKKVNSRTKKTTKQKSTSRKKFDVFISHASEDKESIVIPLVNELEKRNIKVWYDQNVLKWGDSLTESINSGLKNSIFGIVIFSKAFFKKHWTKTELNTLVSLANTTGEKKILPLLYKISHKKLVDEYPILADIIARSWNDGIDVLTEEIQQIIHEVKNT